MYTRPTLPPLDYRLWLPHTGAYVREARTINRRIIGTTDPAIALRLPEAQAIGTARGLIRRTGQVIELRRADLADDIGAGCA